MLYYMPSLSRDSTADPFGTQDIYRFEGTSHGASVVRGRGTYGYSEGLWELAVIHFKSDDLLDFRLCYCTGITDAVLGHLTDESVHEILAQIDAIRPQACQCVGKRPALMPPEEVNE